MYVWGLSGRRFSFCFVSFFIHIYVLTKRLWCAFFLFERVELPFRRHEHVVTVPLPPPEPCLMFPHFSYFNHSVMRRIGAEFFREDGKSTRESLPKLLYCNSLAIFYRARVSRV